MQIICRGSKLLQLSACSVMALLKYGTAQMQLDARTRAPGLGT